MRISLCYRASPQILWVLAALKALADEGKIERAKVAQAMVNLGISPDKVDPVTV